VNKVCLFQSNINYQHNKTSCSHTYIYIYIHIIQQDYKIYKFKDSNTGKYHHFQRKYFDPNVRK
jgi:hypothetical protein